MQIRKLNLIDNQIINITMIGRLAELPKSFVGRGEVKGMLFNQIKRSKRAYVYEVLDESCLKRYEVFTRKIDTRFAKIAYPKANSFGIWAWSARTIEEANKYFDRLNTKIVIKNLNNTINGN